MIVKEVVRDEAQVVLHGSNGAAVVYSNQHPLYHVRWFAGMEARENEAGYMGVYCNVKAGTLVLAKSHGQKKFTAKDSVAVFNAIIDTLPHPNEVVLAGQVNDDHVFMTEQGYFDVNEHIKEGTYVMMGVVMGEDYLRARVVQQL